MLNGKPVYIIAALDAAGGIGRDGRMPWFLPKELAHFHEVTSREHVPGTANTVIVGRLTWESIPQASYAKFNNRRVVVLSHNPDYDPGADVAVATSLEDAWSYAAENGGATYIIGGGEIYDQTVNDPRVDELLLTHIEAEFDCTVFFPDIPSAFNTCEHQHAQQEQELTYSFCTYKRSLT